MVHRFHFNSISRRVVNRFVPRISAEIIGKRRCIVALQNYLQHPLITQAALQTSLHSALQSGQASVQFAQELPQAELVPAVVFTFVVAVVAAAVAAHRVQSASHPDVQQLAQPSVKHISQVEQSAQQIPQLPEDFFVDWESAAETAKTGMSNRASRPTSENEVKAIRLFNN